MTSTAFIHNEREMSSLQERRTQHSATLMYQVDKALCPPPVLQLFKKSMNVSGRSMRLNTHSNFEIPRCRLEMFRRNFVYRGTKLWYNIPQELKNSDSLACFKTDLAKYWLVDGDVDVT